MREYYKISMLNPDWRKRRIATVTEYNERKHHGRLRKYIIKANCEVCAKSGALIIHHINGEGWGVEKPDNRIENLITLCRSCHYKIHHDPTLFDFDSPRLEELLTGLGYIV